MQTKTILYIGAGALLLLLLSGTANAGPVDLSSLSDTYGADKIAKLQALQNALSAAGLSDMQIKLLLAQCLFETGLFTSGENTNAVNNLNNWAGISSGGYLNSYSSVNDFVSDYIPLLQKGADPIDATSVADFNNRLVSNAYYTESPAVYLAGLNHYFNLLS